MERKIIDIEEIARLIPTGHKNALKLEQITALFRNQGWLDDVSTSNENRATRRLLERTGYEYVICNLQDGKGYFRPTKEDLAEYRKWLNQEQARLAKIGKRLSMGRKLFEDFLHERLEEQEI